MCRRGIDLGPGLPKVVVRLMPFSTEFPRRPRYCRLGVTLVNWVIEVAVEVLPGDLIGV